MNANTLKTSLRTLILLAAITWLLKEQQQQTQLTPVMVTDTQQSDTVSPSALPPSVLDGPNPQSAAQLLVCSQKTEASSAQH